MRFLFEILAKYARGVYLKPHINPLWERLSIPGPVAAFGPPLSKVCSCLAASGATKATLAELPLRLSCWSYVKGDPRYIICIKTRREEMEQESRIEP